jgi:hypothetical protein
MCYLLVRAQQIHHLGLAGVRAVHGDGVGRLDGHCHLCHTALLCLLLGLGPSRLCLCLSLGLRPGLRLGLGGGLHLLLPLRRLSLLLLSLCRLRLHLLLSLLPLRGLHLLAPIDDGLHSVPVVLGHRVRLLQTQFGLVGLVGGFLGSSLLGHLRLHPLLHPLLLHPLHPLGLRTLHDLLGLRFSLLERLRWTLLRLRRALLGLRLPNHRLGGGLGADLRLGRGLHHLGGGPALLSRSLLGCGEIKH